MESASKAQISRTAIERIYIAMRHLFIRGGYKPMGMSGEAMINSLLALEPEIYGSIGDAEKVELNGLLYIFQRLPMGIEQCRYVKLISREGYENSSFTPIVPDKRRRNCYRLDESQMLIEMTRGRSDIYDVLTHLTFMYIEAEKIRKNSLDARNQPNRAWSIIEEVVKENDSSEKVSRDVLLTHLSAILGRTYAETVEIAKKFEKSKGVNTFVSIVYHLGKLSMDEYFEKLDREITFSSSLRDQVGHHNFGDMWSSKVKSYIYSHGWQDRPIHIISANMHSVMNCLYGQAAIPSFKEKSLLAIAEDLSKPENIAYSERVKKYALKSGMVVINDTYGTNIPVQIFDTATLKPNTLTQELKFIKQESDQPIIVVMDYAFGEQAYETMDELLKPFDVDGKKITFNIASINIMGKAGILAGKKGDIMIPNAHVFEGTADNYPFENSFDVTPLDGSGLGIYYGPMITVLGTSLQNRDVLRYFLKSSWKASGLEMEGAHYQKAIQAASKIRNSIKTDVIIRYAYYASDNPLETGSTLASGGLGIEGVKPTYLITLSMLNGIFTN